MMKYSVPLIAAEATTFGLIQNVAKDQDRKNLLPARRAPGPVFCRAFARFFKYARHCESALGSETDTGLRA